jgi:hypothetical protein
LPNLTSLMRKTDLNVLIHRQREAAEADEAAEAEARAKGNFVSESVSFE